MKYGFSLGLTLFVVWLLLSGQYTFDSTLILALGLASCVVIVALALRMKIVDTEGHPIHLLSRGLLYTPWLLWAIVKSNIDITRLILSPSLPISPTMVEVKTSQKSELGQVIFANSITLTPGTVSVDIVDGTILVHALSRESAAEVADGEMDRRVTELEGAS